jgi:hypothetical protein
MLTPADNIMDDLAFKSQVHKWAIECIARSPLRNDLILHGGSVFSYCFDSGRVPKDVDFRLASHVHNSLASGDDGSSYAVMIGDVLSEYMPRVCPIWMSRSDSIRRMLHVDLFTPLRDEQGVIDMQLFPACSVRIEGLELAMANKLYLLAGLGSRVASATDLFDVASTFHRCCVQHEQICRIITLMTRRRHREARIRSITPTICLSDLAIDITESALSSFGSLTLSIPPTCWIDQATAIELVVSAFDILQRVYSPNL